MSEPLVELRNATVAFPGVTALDGVDLRLFPGEVHALMGENGAGKSTIIKALNGVLSLDGGELLLDGTPTTFSSPAESYAAGIATVFQDIHLGPKLNVVENVMLGHEVRGRFGINWTETRAKAAAILADLGLDDLDLGIRLSNLNPAVQQLVAIARAMVGEPRVLLLDEPTSSLDPPAVQRLFRIIATLRDRGVAVVFVSHFLEQVYAISDRMTVLRDGKVEGEFRTRDIDRVELISTMLGGDIEALRQIGSERRAHGQDPEGDPVLEAQELAQDGVVEPVDLMLYRGEVVGFAGLRGSGRTELASLLAGVARPDAGTLRVDGRTVRFDSPGEALTHRVVASTERRAELGIIGDLSVADNIVLSLQALRGWRNPVSRRERDELVQWSMENFGIGALPVNLPARFLSGGQQQKVMLARLFATRPLVMVLDEPTRGVDIASKVDLQATIGKLVDRGMAVVFISSEFTEVVRMSDRIVVLKDRGKIGELSNGPGVTVDTVVEMIAADGVEDDLGDD